MSQRDDYDSPWKDVLELYLKDFFELYFPKIHGGVDWSRPPISKDKELLKIFPKSEVTHRLADKLFQIWTVDGEPFEVMVNIEIQAQRDQSFAERVFIYNYRTFDRFRRPVVSVALLCDEDRSFHPKGFTACDLWDCKMHLEFPTVKLLEYNSRWAELEASANPFALVTMAHLKTQATRARPEERLTWKIRLIRSLYNRGFGRNDVLNLFRFIDWIMTLPEELSQRVKDAVHEIEAEKNVQYVTSIERLAIEDGKTQGIQQGEANLLRALLIGAFGSLPPRVEDRLQNASSADIARWAGRFKKADSLEEIFD